MHFLRDALGINPQNHSRVQQVIDQGTVSQPLIVLHVITPVVQQLAAFPGKNAVTPGLIGITPVGGFVDHFFGRGRHLAILDQTHLHRVDTTGQTPGVQGLQAAGNRLAVNQHAVAVHLDQALPAWRDINGVGTGAGVADRQAVAGAIHETQRGVRAGAKIARPAVHTQCVGGEIAQAEKVAGELALAVKLVQGVIGGGAGFTGSRQFGRSHLGPVAEAARGLDVIACCRAGLGAATAGDVQLIVQNQAITAVFGQGMVLGGCALTLYRIGQNRKLRVLQVVMQGHQAIATVRGATAQSRRRGQLRQPLGTIGLGQGTGLGIGKAQQADGFIATEHHQCIPEQLCVDIDTHRQRHIKEVFLKAGRQLFCLT